MSSISRSQAIRTIQIHPHRYHTWEEAGRFYLRALHTGAVRAFTTRAALERFIGELREHLTRKYGSELQPPQEPTPTCFCARCFCGQDALIRHPLNGSPLCAEHAGEALDALDELYTEYHDQIRDQRSAGYPF